MAAAAATARRTHVRWVPILALIAIGTAINYLDRTVLGVAAPYLTKDLGLTPTADGPGLLRLLVELRAPADSRRHLPRQVRHAVHVFHRHRVLVALHRADGRRQLAQGPDRDPHRDRHLRSAVLPRQQPRPRDVVSAARARARQLGLLGRHELRPGLPQRAAVLDHAAVRLARPVPHRRRHRHRVLLRLVGALSQSERAPDGQPGGARLHRGRRRRRVQGTAARLQVALHRRAAAAPAGDRRVDRPVRRQLDAGVLPDVVSDLPGHRARDDLHQGRRS